MTPQAPSSHPLSVKETAEFLGVCCRTIYNLVDRGELPFFRAGKTIRFRKPTLEAWIQAQENHAPLSARERPVVQQLLGAGPGEAGKPPPIPPAAWHRPHKKGGGGRGEAAPRADRGAGRRGTDVVPPGALPFRKPKPSSEP
ncbi:MAG: helix-turn-helix domain-containing protein [Myxococcota bacterium]